MALDPIDAARLAGLEAAYDQLIKGGLVAKISSQGRSMEYSQADKDQLYAEIEKLRALGRDGRRRGALTFRF